MKRESKTTKAMESILIIWYELAEMSIRPIKFRELPNMSSSAGITNTKGTYGH